MSNLGNATLIKKNATGDKSLNAMLGADGNPVTGRTGFNNADGGNPVTGRTGFNNADGTPDGVQTMTVTTTSTDASSSSASSAPAAKSDCGCKKNKGSKAAMSLVGLAAATLVVVGITYLFFGRDKKAS